jgi:hypothetical protein
MATKKSDQRPKKKAGQKPGSMHLDKRVDQILADPAFDGKDDDLLTVREAAAWLGVSIQWLEIRRSSRSDGPPFVQLSKRDVMYPRGGMRAWLKARTYTSTSQYPDDDDRRPS